MRRFVIEIEQVGRASPSGPDRRDLWQATARDSETRLAVHVSEATTEDLARASAMDWIGRARGVRRTPLGGKGKRA